MQFTFLIIQRTMFSAKYFAHNNSLKVEIDERFNERIHGVNTWMSCLLILKRISRVIKIIELVMRI